MRLNIGALFVTAVGLTVTACGGASGSAVSTGDLDGTTWCAPQQHSRLAVDRLGTVEVKEGKDVCLVFTSKEGNYIVKIIWWNVSKAIHVEEWAVALPTSDSTLQYVEADHAGQPDFPGIAGEGEITMMSDGQMQLVQVGHLTSGASAGFITTLVKVDQVPEIPVPLTYPTG